MTPRPAVLPQLPPDTDDSDLLSDDCWDLARAARFFGMSTSWVYRSVESGLLPHRKVGGRLRFIPSELRAWRAKQPGKSL